MKRLITFLLACVLILSMAPAVYAYETPAVSWNQDQHFYVNAQRFNDPITSVLAVESGGYSRVECIGEKLVVEKYDKNFQFVSGQEIALELPYFGGVYLCDDYNFVVVGQDNMEEDNNKEVFRIIRYSKDWVRQDSASICGANTTIPFDAGSLRFARSGNILYIRTAHEMYTSSDGLNHQANVMISVRINDMTVTDQLTDVLNMSYGYVSHSFNQFVLVDGGDLLAVDHGDYYPRSVVLTKYRAPAGQETFFGRVDYVEPLPITSSTYHYNDTGVSVGGFEASSSHYLIAGCSADQSTPSNLMYAHRNIFVTATPKDDFSDDANRIHWLTSYEESDNVQISPPHLVKLSDERFFLIWTENGLIRYCTLDGTGTLEGQIHSMEGDLSDCVPVVDGSKIIWYVTTASEPVFYVIDLMHTHSYTAKVTAPTCTQQGYTNHTCTCGDSYTDSYVDALGHSWGDWVTTKEPTAAATGTAERTCGDCGTKETKTLDKLIDTHTHNYSGKVTTKPTCTKNGIMTYTCACGAYYTEEIPVTDHTYASTVTAPTCTEAGYTTYICQCGHSYTANETEPLGHTFVNGECTVCGVSAPSVVRIYGDTRYYTAIEIAERLKETLGLVKFDAIVVASGTEFADALSGTYLANRKNAPVLLVRDRNQEMELVKNYIRENLVPGGTVYILGGTKAVPAAMETGLENFEIVRLGGATRYETNLLILQEAGVQPGEDLLICTGKDFPDSLAASAVNKPILLVKESLTAGQQAYLNTVKGSKLYIIGGTAAVNARIENNLTAYGTTQRLSGATRYHTSVEIAKTFFPDATKAIIAYGENFPDGMCGGTLAYSMGAPVLLATNSKSTAAVSYTTDNGISCGVVLGGTKLISDSTMKQIFD